MSHTQSKAITLKQTCEAFPSQWEGFLRDGRSFYIRFRHGNLTVQFSESKFVASHRAGDEAVDGPEVFRCGEAPPESFGDGIMSTAEMKEATKTVIDWSAL